MSDHKPLLEQREHAHDAQQQTEHAKYLHVANQIDAVTQIANLRQQILVPFGLILAVQIADDRRQRVEAVGVRQHQQRHSGEKQGGSGDVHAIMFFPPRGIQRSPTA